jgi:ribosomal protein S3
MHSNLISMVKKYMEQSFDSSENNVDNKIKVKGILFQVKGRINGIDRKKKTVISIGNMPKQSISKNIDFASSHAKTPFGVCSVKLWVYWDKLFY